MKLRAAIACALVLVGVPALAASDPWAGLVGADRAGVEKALGAPAREFIGFIVAGHTPLRVETILPPADSTADWDSVKVLEYPNGTDGVEFQVVLKDDHVLYAVAPPADDERDARSVAKKYGKRTLSGADLFAADTIRSFQTLEYRKKGRVFVERPGEETIIARVILPPDSREGEKKP